MNVFFRVKVALVILAAALTLVLQRSLANREGSALTHQALVAIAGVSILAWTAIIFCGRFIAYFGNLAE